MRERFSSILQDRKPLFVLSLPSPGMGQIKDFLFSAKRWAGIGYPVMVEKGNDNSILLEVSCFLCAMEGVECIVYLDRKLSTSSIVSMQLAGISGVLLDHCEVEGLDSYKQRMIAIGCNCTSKEIQCRGFDFYVFRDEISAEKNSDLGQIFLWLDEQGMSDDSMVESSLKKGWNFILSTSIQLAEPFVRRWKNWKT